jgi:DNA-binding transcriptional MerR regulator
MTLGVIAPSIGAMGEVQEPQIRVEELAARVGVSVDTVRFYQKRGLLDRPIRRGRIALYGESHLEQLERIKALQSQGLTLSVISRVIRGELDDADLPLAAVVARARVDQGESSITLLTPSELSQRSGVPVELIDAVMRDGLLVPRWVDGVPYFTGGDVDVVQAGLAFLGAGIPLPELLALARRHDQAVRQTAEEAVELFDTHVRQSLRQTDLSPDVRAARLVEAFDLLLPAATSLVAHHFRRVLLEVAQEHLESVGEPAEIAAAAQEAKRLAEQP